MKKTALRVWSILLTLCLVMGLLTTAVYAEEESIITKQPVSVTAEKGEKVTLSVEAEGENLQYNWYVPGMGVLGEYEGFTDADTATLTIESASCHYNEWEFYCDIYAGGDWERSEPATVTVPHAETEAWNYFYTDADHMEHCVDCGAYHNRGAHAWGEDGVTCAICGYDSQTETVTTPVFLDFSISQNVNPGEAVEMTVDVYGEEPTYQWYKCTDPNPEAERIAIVDGNGVTGATTDTLKIESVDCAMSGYCYICEVTNSAGHTSASGWLYVNHVFNEYKPSEDGIHHGSFCICGGEMGLDPHEDAKGDGVCDVCEYQFPAGAPKITAHPKSVKVKNGHDPVTFTVTATGDNLTYQWYTWGGPLENDEKFSGVDTATLTVKSLYDKENEIYDCNAWSGGLYCLVSNEKGGVVSKTANYNVEHEEVVECRPWNDYYHDSYCVCGGWIEEAIHVDQDDDKKCDLCKATMPEFFPDVSDDQWYYEAAVYGKSTGLFVGYENGEFRPNNAITRGEAATVLARSLFGEKYLKSLSDDEFKALVEEWKVEGANTAPTDIKGYYYERHVQILVALDIIKGYDDGTFQGNKVISREELSALMVRYMEFIFGDDLETFEVDEPVDAFKDADQVAEWAKEEVEIARAIGLFRGDENANLMPKSNSTRAQVAETLRRVNFPVGMFGEPVEE